MRVMRWKNGALSRSELANEPGLGCSRTYQPGEIPLPTKPRPGVGRMDQEMNCEAASSQLRAAVPLKRARVEENVQTNETMQDLNGTMQELEKTRRELDQVTETMLSVEEDKQIWKRQFEDCNKKQREEIERLRREYKERWQRLVLTTTAVEKAIPASNVPRGKYPMELLTPRELSQTTEVRLPTTAGRVTIPDPSDTLGDPVVEQTVRKLIETTGRLVTNGSAPGSGMTAPDGRIDDTGRVELFQETMKKTGVDKATLPAKISKVPDRKIRGTPMKKVSRVFDVQKNSQVKNNFTGVPDEDPRSCFNRSTWSPAINMQQPPLGTIHLILCDCLVKVLQNLRNSWITTVMGFGGVTIAQLH